MLLQFDAKTQALYSKLFVSRQDLSYARQCAAYLLKNGLHHKPWEKRGGIYFRQFVFTTSLIVSYARPFTQSRGWPNFPRQLVSFSKEEQKLHERLLKLRHQVYAHSDSGQFSIRSWRSGTFETDIVGAPFYLLKKAEISTLVPMIDKLCSNIDERIKGLRACKPAPVSD